MKPTLKTILLNALLYLFLGGIWILLTDQIVLHLVTDPRTLTLIQTFKGIAFVAVSAAFLYLIGRRDLLALKSSEEFLRRECDLFEKVMETSPAGITVMNREGRIIFANYWAEQVLGLTKDEITKRSYNAPEWHITDYEGNAVSSEKLPFNMVLATGRPVRDAHLAIERPGRRRIFLSVNAAPLRDEAGNILEVVATVQDITKRKKAEEELRLLQEMTKAICEAEDFHDAVNIAIRKFCEVTGWVYGEAWVPAPDKSYLEMNLAWYSSIKGLEEFREESKDIKFYKDVGLPGRVWASKKPLWVRDLSADKNFLRTQLVERFELKAGMGIPIIAKDEVVAVLTFFVHEDMEENEALVILISTIALQLGGLFKRKQAEEALKDSEEKYRTLAEAAQDIIYVINREDRVEYVNNFGAGLLGLKPEKVIGRQRETLFPPDESQRQKNHLNKVFETGQPLYAEDRIHFLKEEAWLHTSLVPMRNKGGEVSAVMGVSRDITQRKRIEEELRLLQTLLQDVTLSADFRSALEASLRKICETTGWVFGEVWIPSSDGTYLECGPAWYSTSPKLNKFRKISEGFRFQSGIGLPGRVWSSKKAAWVTDVTMDANFPRAPYAMEAGLKAAMSIPILAEDKVVAVIEFFVFEKREEDGRLVTLVSTVAAYIGILFQRMQAEDMLREREKRYRTLISNIPDVTWTTDSNGKIFFISPNIEKIYGYAPEEIYRDFHNMWLGRVHPDDTRRVRESFELLFSENKGFGIEYRIQKKDGEWIWLRDRAVGTYKKDGATYADGIFSDITEYKRLEAQLRHSQKLEAVGQLVGGIAHDFNNVLTAIIGFAGILHMKMKKDDPLIVNVEQILESAERGAGMTQNLLVFGRKQAFNMAPVDIADLIKRMEKLLVRLISENIELRTVIEERELVVTADIVQIEQVIINLATNARDAMPDGGTLTIEARSQKLNREFIKAHGYGKPGTYAVISVSDTGLGMDEKTRQRIFEPFFTTKEVGKGTGLGLSIVYGIIKQHNGFINVYSEVGKGTTFRVYLPMGRGVAGKAKAAELAAPVTGTETVLVAEDDASVRSLLKKLLETFGYKVIEAADGEEAVQRYMENKDNIRLLILDVIMPKKSGKEAYEQIREVSPGIKTLFMSGYTADVIQTKWIVEKGLDFVSKPISPTDFLRKIREVLDK